MNISHIGFMGLNEISSILDWTEFSKAKDFNILEDNTVRDNTDVIILGMGDGGFDITSILDDLILANDSGVGIIFMHDIPNYAEYDKRLLNFGISEIDKSFDYNLFSNTKILIPDHSIITSFYDIKTMSLAIQETHNRGIVLSESCSIVLNDPNIIASNKNYYLACLENIGKGRVAHISLGHNGYRSDILLELSSEEASILANTLIWTANL
jgi:hypothetical protein